jgi:small subunit ribosomal protein S15
MARMHTRRRGSSGSKRPILRENPPWVPLEAREVEELVLKMHNEGLTAAQIGLRLRDQYGVPNVRLATGKPMLQLLKGQGAKIDVPEDLRSLMRRAVGVQGHLRENPSDLHNRRGLELIEAKIRRLVRYYKDEGILPRDWDYSMKAAELKVK